MSQSIQASRLECRGVRCEFQDFSYSPSKNVGGCEHVFKLAEVVTREHMSSNEEHVLREVLVVHLRGTLHAFNCKEA